jgi:hypothetical protein
MSKSTISIIQQRLNPTPTERMRAQSRLRLAMRPWWVRMPAMQMAMSCAVVTLLVSLQTLPTDPFYEARKLVIEGFQHVTTYSDDEEFALEADQILSRINDEEVVATNGPQL